MNISSPLDFNQLIFSDYSVSELIQNPENKLKNYQNLINKGNIIVFKNELNKHEPSNL